MVVNQMEIKFFDEISPKEVYFKTDINTSVTESDKRRLKAAIKQENKDAILNLLKRFAIDRSRVEEILSDLLFHVISSFDCDCDIIPILASFGANVNSTNSKGCSPLIIAIKHSNKNAVRQLLELGANVNVRTEKGSTALHYALQKEKPCDPEIINLLLQFSADVNCPNNSGLTPLTIAVKRQNKSAVENLLKSGADVNVRTKQNMTPLHYAVMKTTNDLDIAQNLLKFGADINCKNNKGQSPLAITSSRDNLPMTTLLLRNGADVNLQNRDLFTALHFAVNFAGNNVINELVDNGADVNAEALRQITPMYCAIHRKNVEIAKLLISKGARVKDHDFLHDVCRFNCPLEFIKLLIDEGVDVNMRDQKQRTCLHYAVKKNSIDSIKLLLENGADVNVVDQFGLSPLQLSINEEREDITELLLKHTIELKSFGERINEKNLKCLSSYSSGTLSRYEVRCEMEVERIKNDVISEDHCFSLYDVIIKPADRFLLLLQDNAVRLKLEKTNYRLKYPIFSKIIVHRVEEIVEKAKLYKKFATKIREILDKTFLLPTNVIYEIMRNFNESDMQQLVNTHLL